jgi:membrane-bound ClpP family serine protease
LAWLGLAWLGLAWLGLAWLGLAWLGLAWLGLTWFGLAWLGLAWLVIGACLVVYNIARSNFVPVNTSGVEAPQILGKLRQDVIIRHRIHITGKKLIIFKKCLMQHMFANKKIQCQNSKR